MSAEKKISEQIPWTREEFEQKLRDKEKYYHINHEFHILMDT